MFSMSVFKSLILEIILLDGLNNWDYQDICTVYPTDAHINKFQRFIFSADVNISVWCVFTETSLTTFTLSIWLIINMCLLQFHITVLTSLQQFTNPHEDATKLSKWAVLLGNETIDEWAKQCPLAHPKSNRFVSEGQL